MVSPEWLTHAVPSIITVVPTAARYTLVLTHPKPPTGSAGHRLSRSETVKTGKKWEKKNYICLQLGRQGRDRLRATSEKDLSNQVQDWIMCVQSLWNRDKKSECPHPCPRGFAQTLARSVYFCFALISCISGSRVT